MRPQDGGVVGAEMRPRDGGLIAHRVRAMRNDYTAQWLLRESGQQAVSQI